MLCFVKIKKYLKDKSNSYVLWLFFRVPCRPCWALSRRLYYQSQQSERVTIPVSKCSQASQVSQMSKFLETKTYKAYFPPVGLIESWGFYLYVFALCCRSAGPTLTIDIQRSKAYEILDSASWQQVLPPNSSIEQMELRQGQDDNNSGELSDDSHRTDGSVDEGIFSLPSHLITSTPLPLFLNGHQVLV